MANGVHSGITARLQQMKVGEMIVLAAAKAHNVTGLAKRIGIKVATRRQGSGKRVKVWRLE